MRITAVPRVFIAGWAALLSFAVTGNSLAADQQPRRPPADTAASESKTTPPDPQYRATDIIELRVTNRQKEELGVISELLIDRRGRVSHVVLQAGGLLGVGEERYVVPWNRIKIGSERKEAIIDVTKERLPVEFAAFESEGD